MRMQYRDDTNIDHALKETEQAGKDTKDDELSVVGPTNAIIEPEAMMVKDINATIALSTVLRSIQDIRSTHLTKILQLLPWISNTMLISS
jgi:hypothetical protein